jgi:hypothetical protein
MPLMWTKHWGGKRAGTYPILELEKIFLKTLELELIDIP